MIETNKAVFAVTLKEFKEIGGKNEFAGVMYDRAPQVGFNPGPSEKSSWAENFDALKALFNKCNLPDDVVLAFEYRAPVGGRVDCMLFGKSKDGKKSIVLIELKGWRDATLSYNNSLINTFTGGRLQDVDHPSVQVEGYNRQFTDFFEQLNSEGYQLTSFAYCYNYKTKEDGDALFHSTFEGARNKCPLFIADDNHKFAESLHSLLNGGNGLIIFNDVSSWHPKPTTKLIQAASDIILDEDNFHLFGDQNVVFRKLETILNDSFCKDEKSVIVVKGGPGTGKTLLALKMLSYAARKGKTPMFATRSTALRDQLKNALHVVGKVNDKDASNLISDIYQIRPSRYNENELDLLLIDEAHRVAENNNSDKTGRYSVEVECEGKGNPYCPLNQTISLIYCSKVTVFFIDDHQAVKSSEVGKSRIIIEKAKNYQEEIKKDIAKFIKGQERREQRKKVLEDEKSLLDQNLSNLSQQELAKREKLNIKLNQLERELGWSNCLQHVQINTQMRVDVLEPLELKTQFRCSGGDKFVAWLDDVLYKAPTSINLILKKDDFNFKIFDNPSDLYESIRNLNDPNKNITARLCAGWCWPWDNHADSNGDLKKEVNLTRWGFNFSMPWETKDHIIGLNAEYRGSYAPDTNSWASHPMGINQVGCIHTAQGFEFDYVGVIIGPDLVYDESNDCLKCIARENQEGQVTDKNADSLVRNIYRVLMSRGKKGCYIYCCDSKVKEYFERFSFKMD